MEKEFVPYKPSLKLRELGFDEPCFGFWSKIHGLFITTTSGKLNEEAGECLAPTFSQAFRFIMQFPPLNKWRCNIALYSDGTYSIKDGKDVIYEYLSSESCLEKLIEIVESNEK